MFVTYTGNRQFDLQLNRTFSGWVENPIFQEDLKEILPQLVDIPSWNQAWKKKSFEKEASHEYKLAASYFQVASFYVLKDSPDWRLIQEARLRNFYKAYDLGYERYDIPFEGSTFPAARLSRPDAKKELLIMGGYDSNLEELMLWMMAFKDLGYNLTIFDGPGQGNVLFQENTLLFRHDFEQPVSAVLDYFQLDGVTTMGLSWGGYFVMRAAAFEKRIKKVIAYDIFYQGMDALTIDLAWYQNMGLHLLTLTRQKRLLNAILRQMMAKDLDVSWKISRGMDIIGVETPYDLLKTIEKHTMRGIEHLIDQNVLLLAGENDQYVPAKCLALIQKKLVSAASVESYLFTEETGGQEHCQVGSDVAVKTIQAWLLSN